MLEWPAEAVQELRQPESVESFLRSEISRRSISLVGELELTEPTSYANTNWSMLELAEYLVGKPIFKSALTMWPEFRFPASLAIWAVGHAQTADDGGGLWIDLSGYSDSEKNKLKERFLESITFLGLEDFHEMLAKSHRFVEMARIHAMIPEFALEKYASTVKQGVRFHRAPEIILKKLVEDTTIAVGVRRLFSVEPDLGLDLIKRSSNFLRFGYEADLPQRITNGLVKLGSEIRIFGGEIQEFPKVNFNEWKRSVDVNGAGGWKICAEEHREIEHLSVPAEKIYVEQGDSGKILIQNPDDGFLIFSIKGELLPNSRLPNEGGYFFWNQEVEFLTDIPFAEPSYVDNWPGWQFTYFQDLDILIIKDAKSKTHTLTVRKNLSVSDYPVEYLFLSDGRQVYSDYPSLAAPQILKITDNLKGTQEQIEFTSGSIVNGVGGEIDLALSAGLGKFREWQGLVVPGLITSGLTTPLVDGEKREVKISVYGGWSVSKTSESVPTSELSLLVRGDVNSQTFPTFELISPDESVYIIEVRIPILSWSLEFKKGETQMAEKEIQVDISEKKSVQALVLHEVEDYVPRLNIDGHFTPGRQRGKDVRYDLRHLNDDKTIKESLISVKWNYQDLNLVRFRVPQRRETLRLKSFGDLPDGLVAAGIWSPETWSEYRSTAQMESRLLQFRLKLSRGRK